MLHYFIMSAYVLTSLLLPLSACKPAVFASGLQDAMQGFRFREPERPVTHYSNRLTEEMIRFAWLGKTQEVRSWLDAGADVNGRTLSKDTALILAARGFPDTVQLLLERGADVNGRGAGGVSALMEAVGQGQRRTVEMLLKSGADVNSVNDRGETALHLSVDPGFTVQSGDLGVQYHLRPDHQILAMLLAKHPDLERKANSFGTGKQYTALMLALELHRPRVASQLIRAGANTSGTAESALIGTIEGQDRAAVHRLLEAGANPDAVSFLGVPALNLAARAGDLETVRDLLARGAGVNARDSSGQTALMRSLRFPHVTRLLLGHGADVRAVDREGDGVMYYAARYGGKADSVRLLLDRGFPLDAPINTDRLTSLMCAAEWGNTEMTEVLLERGASLTAKASYTSTALHWAAERPFGARDKSRIIALLLKAGANPNAQQYGGDTPLIYYIRGLLDENLAGQTAFEKLERRQDAAAVRALLRGGADLSVKNAQGQTALALAKEKNRQDIVNLLLSAGAKE